MLNVTFYNEINNKDVPQKSGENHLETLKNGNRLFQSYSNLTSFSSDLSSLVNGSQMFQSCSNLTSFSSDLSSLVNGYGMFSNTSLTSFSSDLSSLVNGNSMFYKTSLTSFNSDLSSLVDSNSMFSKTSLTSFNSDLSSLVEGLNMFGDCASLTSFVGDLSSLVSGSEMFGDCKLTPQSVIYIIESIRNIKEEKAKYTSGEIPWVTKDSTTGEYSKPFGFMQNGYYVYTNIDLNYYTDTVTSSYAGYLSLGIDVIDDSETIEQQLLTFAEACNYESWGKLVQEFTDKGWTASFRFNGSDSSITLSEDEQFRGVPIYARLIEEENKDKAEYCTEDGTKFYNIDWGHDVTDYDQYQYFGSLLEACGYYGVIPKKYLSEQ